MVTIKTDILDKNFTGLSCTANPNTGDKITFLSQASICKSDVLNKKNCYIKDSDSINSTNIKDFKITCQKSAFIEIKIDFNKIVDKIIGLPQNLYWEKGYIKGTPERSGQYSINIIFTDATSYNFDINIPSLKRLI